VGIGRRYAHTNEVWLTLRADALFFFCQCRGTAGNHEYDRLAMSSDNFKSGCYPIGSRRTSQYSSDPARRKHICI